MTARTRWILAIVALLTANVVAMVILTVRAGTPHLDPRYRGVEQAKP